MKKYPLALLLFSIGFIISCKKSQIENSTPLLEGQVILYDEGNQVLDNSGIKVSIENSDPQVKIETDSKGNFFLPVKDASQLFTIVLEKQGMGTYKRYFKKMENGELHEMGNDGIYRNFNPVQPYQLGSKTSVIINSLDAQIVNDKLKLNLNISSPNITGEKYIRVLLQKDLHGLSLNTVTNSIKNVGSILMVQNGNNSFEFFKDFFMYCQEYMPGDKIYITAYGDAFYSNWYTDLQSGQWKFPNLNFVENNPVASFTIQ